MPRRRRRPPEVQPAATRSRDPQGTKQKILAAGLKEFANHGFAGARVDAIARRAGVNKRMLYHYFGPKEQLYREIMRRKVLEKNSSVEGSPHDLVQALPWWYELARSDPDWIRLLQWEALRVGARSKVVSAEERREGYAEVVERLRGEQANGDLPANVDARHLLLATVALSVYPLAFPQMVRLIMDVPPSDRGFKRGWAAFLRHVGDSLRSTELSPGQVEANGLTAAAGDAGRPADAT